MSLQQTAQELMRVASEDLLLSLDRTTTRQKTVDLARLLALPDEYAASLIEFAGEKMTGSVLFLSDFQFFAARLPVRRQAVSPTPKSARDWLRVRDACMELTNQLLARVTNQLHRLGVVVEPLLPVALSGPAIAVVVRSRTETPYVYATDSQHVFVWFEVHAKEGTLGRPEPPRIVEGDFVQF